MTSKTFVSGTVIDKEWLNDVNATTYTTVPNIISGAQAVGLATAATTATTATNATNAVNVTGTIASAVTATTQTAGDNTTKVATTAFVTTAVSAVTAPKQIQTVGASVAANALTISATSLQLDFRSGTLTSGAVASLSGTPTNLVVPSGATLGTVSAVQSDLIVLAINNSGTIELAVVNLAGGTDLSETGVISTTAISAGATSASTIYSTTARTGVAYRVIGLIRSTQTTAGTWATAPSLIQGAGGNALDAMMSIGYSQTWQDLTGSRAKDTTYYNTTGKPISVAVSVNITTTGAWFMTVNGVNITTASSDSSTLNSYGPTTIIVPAGQSYKFTTSTGSPTVTRWAELR